MIKQPTKTPRKKTTAKAKATLVTTSAHIRATMSDFKSALLVVSLLVNVFFLISWMAIRLTSQYDLQVASFLFNR